MLRSSSVCMQAFHSASTAGGVTIQSGYSRSNNFLVMLLTGLNTRAEAYTWRGLFSIAHRKDWMNRRWSWTSGTRGDPCT